MDCRLYARKYLQSLRNSFHQVGGENFMHNRNTNINWYWAEIRMLVVCKTRNYRKNKLDLGMLPVNA